ncbi:MAG: zinc ribbon domain-containing protein, partial [Clostridia bacterium]|nr:zinc ribbon domain-containing protein [Clostridia bacterium]
MAFCPKCGSPMFDGAQYCMSCGGNINPLGAGGASAFRMFMLKNHTLIRVALTATCVSFVLTFLVNILQSGLFLGLILSALPGLMAGALLFIASQENKTGPFPSSGFTVIKVCTIISLVLASLAAAVMFLYGAV